jgi:hypothetical protein
MMGSARRGSDKTRRDVVTLLSMQSAMLGKDVTESVGGPDIHVYSR